MIKKFLFHVLKISLFTAALSYIILKVPELHYSYIRNHTENALVRVTNSDGSHGGTGFHVAAPSGGTYIITNSHVCSGVGVNGEVYVFRFEEPPALRKIIENSDFTDLCLIESLPGVSGLIVGSETEIGRILSVIGHPLLMPTTVSRGEIIGSAVAQVLEKIMDKDDTCDKPKNKIVELDLFFFKVNACIIEIKANASNIVILPGNSGSPLVDFYGRVVGVAFAGDEQANWAWFITLEDLNKFLGKY